MSSKKNNYFSTAKGIGIILMVMGHCGAPDLWVKFIYEFHMPLFFFCSGYFIKDIDSKAKLFQTYKKKFQGIYIKFVIWSLIFLALHNTFFHLNIYNEIILFHGKPSSLYFFPDYCYKTLKIVFTMNEHEQLIRSFWFLKQLFIASLTISTILYLTNKVARYKYTHFAILIILFAMTFISKYYNWSLPAIWEISLVFMSSSFFLSGHVFRQYHLLEKLNNKTIPTICFFFLIIGLYTLPWTNMLEYNLRTVFPFYIVAFSGIILTLTISKRLESSKLRFIFYYIGQNTMVIFILHMLCFKIGNLIKIAIYNWPIYRLAEFQIIKEHNTIFWIVYTIIGISVPIYIDYIMKKCQYTNNTWKYLV